MEDDPWAASPTAGPSSRPHSPSVPPFPNDHVPVGGLDDLSLGDNDPFTSSSSPHLAPLGPAADGDNDGFDDFDDFDEPAAGALDAQGEGGGDDDEGFFGDFGDFDEGDFDEPADSAPAAETSSVPEMGPAWSSLHLDPLPNRGDMLDQLSTLLSPLLPPPETGMTTEHPRQVGGLTQIMVAESSREAYLQLTAAPVLKPLDWVRSRTRRDHLISMGVPVNLDEVDSHRLTVLPPLRINTLPPTPQKSASGTVSNGPMTESPIAKRRFSSEEKGKGRNLSPQAAMANESRLGNGRPNSMPAAGALNANGSVQGGSSKYGLGKRPELDMSKAEELCGLEEGQMSLLSLERIQALQKQLVDNSAHASALLAWLLQLKDAQTQDSATYNGMISEVIANAAKAKTAQATSGGVFRRSSGRRPTGSGSSTPARVASPSIR